MPIYVPDTDLAVYVMVIAMAIIACLVILLAAIAIDRWLGIKKTLGARKGGMEWKRRKQ